MATAVREKLNTDHPLRRMLKPFTFRTISINGRAVHTLVPVGAFNHRALTLTGDELQRLLSVGAKATRFATFHFSQIQQARPPSAMPSMEHGTSTHPNRSPKLTTMPTSTLGHMTWIFLHSMTREIAQRQLTPSQNQNRPKTMKRSPNFGYAV